MGFTWERTAIGKVPVGINASGTCLLNWQANTVQRFGGAVEATGGSQPHNNLQPYEVMAF